MKATTAHYGVLMILIYSTYIFQLFPLTNVCVRNNHATVDECPLMMKMKTLCLA